MFYELTPEVAGHLGPATVVDQSSRPQVARAVEYQFDDWPEDDLIEAFPCFLVTDRMRRLLVGANASGCNFGPVKITTSEQFDELAAMEDPPRPVELPQFAWLIPDGTAGQSDFGISEAGTLVVSWRILEVLKQGSLSNCDIIPL